MDILRTRAIMQLGSILVGASQSTSSRLLHSTLLTTLGNNMLPHLLQPSFTPITPKFPALPPSTAPLLHFFQLFILHFFVIVALETAVSHNIYFCTNNFVHTYSFQQVIDLIQGFWSLTHHKYKTIAEIYLGYPAVAQNRSLWLVREDGGRL